MENIKHTPFLDFYKKCMKTRRIPSRGLCNALRFYGEPFELVAPSKEDHPEHWVDGFAGYWGYDGEPISSHVAHVDNACAKKGITITQAGESFTPFRQTIVLLCAAINDEL